ncbi:hypothetical protein ELB75_09885 [Eikenella corrodens]|uniref:Uncharacterized protein n=1 Tax=Eikenella corrodens TaxID=539 RepID=A0A3S9SL99_EIKCO|nr:hypothetical protein ELB75_09885 [Eikenella corrodens]
MGIGAQTNAEINHAHYIPAGQIISARPKHFAPAQPAAFDPPAAFQRINKNRYSIGSPCRNVCTVCGSPPCPDFC